MNRDAFGTAGLRAAVLQAWAASPARFREDANSEEDHARGYYRDRVVIELAQNAADAASRAGVPGHLLLRLSQQDGTTVLTAANTGAPLDADGVASLASLRASAKRGAGATTSTVGRFGVGFAAVRSVADELRVASTTGAVRFSLAEATAQLAALGVDHPELADEARRRDGVLPTLRLPLPDDARPPSGYDTAVVLELRDAAAVDEVRALLGDVGDPLLLALPALTEVVVEVDVPGESSQRRVADVAARWLVARGEGTLELALVADRPVEERAARDWRVTWALPREAGGGAGTGATRWGGVVHAPTPTDERTTLPALLVASLPLDPSRRHVVPGRSTQAVVERAADVYAELARAVVQDGRDPLALVPTGLPAGSLDAALRERVVDTLAATPLLTPARSVPAPDATTTPEAAGDGDGDGDGDDRATTRGPRLIEPRRAVAIAGEVGRDRHAVGALARWAAGLVVLGPGQEAPARMLGVEVRDLADVVAELPAAGEPERWGELYAALAASAGDPLVREALGAIPVPLADGRTVRGVRGLVLPGAHLPSSGPVGAPADAEALEVLGRWGLRLVHPGAAHPLLERLGATAPEAGGLLLVPAVREAVLEAADDDDLALAEAVAAAVLTLVADAVADGQVPTEATAWLGELTLHDADDEPTPARGLVLPGSPAAELLDDRVLAPVADELVERWGREVLVAAGVRDHLALVRLTEVLVEPDGADLLGGTAEDLATRSLDGWSDYLDVLADRLGAGALVGELAAVADLDAVRDDAWPAVLRHVTTDHDLRRALLDPVRAEGDHRHRVAPSSTGSSGTGFSGTAPSYAAWWLRTRTPSTLGLGAPFALPGAPAALRDLLPPPPDALAGLDPTALAALGGVAALAELDGEAWADLLDALGPVGTPVTPEVAGTLWRALAAAAVAGVALDHAPERLPALVGPAEARVVHADDAAVAPAPMWLQRTDLAALVPAPGAGAERLASLLDLPLADELGDDDARGGPHAPAPDDDGAPGPTPDAALALLPGLPRTWHEHEDLHVGGAPVDWWVEGEGSDAVVHATQLAGLARGLAQAAGRWELRHALEVVLTEPERVAELRAEAGFDR